MNMTYKLFFACFCCIVLIPLSGCGGVKLTPAEQVEVDRFMTEHGRSAIPFYLDSIVGNTDKNRALRYVRYLVSQGADVNARNNDGETQLHIAMAYGNVEVTKFLISQRVDVIPLPFHFPFFLFP